MCVCLLSKNWKENKTNMNSWHFSRLQRLNCRTKLTLIQMNVFIYWNRMNSIIRVSIIELVVRAAKLQVAILKKLSTLKIQKLLFDDLKTSYTHTSMFTHNASTNRLHKNYHSTICVKLGIPKRFDLLELLPVLFGFLVSDKCRMIRENMSMGPVSLLYVFSIRPILFCS